MAKQSILITVTGPDKPGLVSALSEVVAAHDGNWLEGRMANLSGQFAGMLRVEVASSSQAELLSDLESLVSTGLTVNMQPVPDLPVDADGHDVELDLLGQDHPGIVRDITQLLSKNGISVQSLDTSIEEASMAGGMLFHAKARLRVPMNMTTDTVHEKLQTLSDSLLVEIAVVDVD